MDLRFEADQEPVWLRLTGRPGVKDFIRDEFISLLFTVDLGGVRPTNPRAVD